MTMDQTAASTATELRHHFGILAWVEARTVIFLLAAVRSVPQAELAFASTRNLQSCPCLREVDMNRAPAGGSKGAETPKNG